MENTDINISALENIDGAYPLLFGQLSSGIYRNW